VFPTLLVVVIVGGHMATIDNNNCNAIVVRGWRAFLPIVVDFLTTKKEVRKEGVNTQLTSSFLSFFCVHQKEDHQ
jgi:hypothetical protein